MTQGALWISSLGLTARQAKALLCQWQHPKPCHFAKPLHTLQGTKVGRKHKSADTDPVSECRDIRPSRLTKETSSRSLRKCRLLTVSAEYSPNSPLSYVTSDVPLHYCISHIQSNQLMKLKQCPASPSQGSGRLDRIVSCCMLYSPPCISFMRNNTHAVVFPLMMPVVLVSVTHTSSLLPCGKSYKHGVKRPLCSVIQCWTCSILLEFLCSIVEQPGTNNLLDSLSKDSVISLIYTALQKYQS